jgi:hypothetical protein
MAHVHFFLLTAAGLTSALGNADTCTATLPGECFHNPSHHLETINVSHSAGECCAKCVANAKCASWTYWVMEQKTDHSCRLYLTITPAVPCTKLNNGTSGVLQPRPTPPPTPPPPTPGPAPPPKGAMNVLMIAIDDLRPQVVCCLLTDCP